MKVKFIQSLVMQSIVPFLTDRRIAAILLVALEICAIVVFAIYVRIPDEATFNDISAAWLSDQNVFVLIGFGLGMTAWLRFQVSGMYWVLVCHCVSIQMLIMLDVLISNENKLELSIPLISMAVRGSLPTLVALAAVTSSCSPSTLVLISILGSVSYSGIIWMRQAFSGYTIQSHYHSYIMDCGGTISIFLFGSVFGLSVVASNYKQYYSLIRRAQFLPAPYNFSYLFRMLGIMFMLAFWNTFVIPNLRSPCLESLSLGNIVMAEFGGIAAAFFASYIRASEDNRVSGQFYLQGAMIGAICLGSLSDIIPLIWITLLLSFAVTLFSLVVGPSLLPAYMSGNNDNIGRVWTCIFVPSLLGGLLSCLILYVISQNNSLYWSRISPFNYFYNSKTILLCFNQLFIILFTIVVGFVSGIIIRAIIRCFDLQRFESDAEMVNFSISDTQALVQHRARIRRFGEQQQDEFQPFAE